MLSDMRAASSDDYFHAEESSGDPDADDREITVPVAPEAPATTLAQEVISALKAARIRGKLRDPRRDEPGGRSDFATASLVQVKLEDGSIATMLRAQKALAAFAWLQGRPARTLYVCRPSTSLAAEIRLALSAQDLIDDWDFRLYDPRGDGGDLTTAETVRLRLISHTSTPWSMRGLLEVTRLTLCHHTLAPTDQQMELLVSRSPSTPVL